MIEGQPQVAGLRSGGRQVTPLSERCCGPMNPRPCLTVWGNIHLITARRHRLRPVDHQAAKAQGAPEIHRPRWLRVIARRPPAGRRIRFENRRRRTTWLGAGGAYGFWLAQRLIIQHRCGELQAAFTARTRRDHQFDGLNQLRPAATGRSPREWQLALADAAIRPLLRHLEIRPQMPPNIGSTWVRDLELKVVVRPFATQSECDLKRRWQREIEHPPDHHKATAAVEIVGQFQPRLAVVGDDAGKLSFRVPRGEYLPGFRIVKQ